MQGKYKTMVGKTLANSNELSLSPSIKTCHLGTTLNLNIKFTYFIITCSIKMVCAFGVSSLVRGHHDYKDVWNAPNDGTYNFLTKENWVIQKIHRL